MTNLLHPEQLASARIMVRVPNWVGDAVMCLPALRMLRSVLPDAEMALLARPWVRDVFPAQELHCRVIPYDTNGEHRGVRGRRRIAAELRAERFDAAILMQNAFDAAFISWLAGIPLRAGYSRQCRRPLLTHPVAPARKWSASGHEAHYYLELLRRLGLISEYPVVELIALPASEASRLAAREQLCERIEKEAAPAAHRPADAAPIVGISPGATFGTAKRWPAPRFAELASRLHKESGSTCVFFGSPQEKDLAEEVMTLARVPSLLLAGRTSLAEFIHLIPGCDLFVTNDTGTMHVAAALGVPTLAIFGPTNEKETRPLGQQVKLVTGEAYCRPCKLRHCPIDHRCMTSVSVECVLQAALPMLCRGNLAPQESSSPAGSPLVMEPGHAR
ncbi:MAG: lipopolysaccharide heptosyltransferase II [Acidobacteria bacterium]|nr:lipopolysaccharide heptosyltransferase II [Acidobacteriota bacterium]